jgi:hypothetical protein
VDECYTEMAEKSEMLENEFIKKIIIDKNILITVINH